MKLLPGTRLRNLNSGVDRGHSAEGERIGGKTNILNEKQILDFKLSPCFESKRMYSFGYFPGV